MTILVLILVALGVFSAVLGLLSHKTGNDEDTIVRADTASCATCSGEDERCEQTCMMEAYVKDIEYYDDEELDIFQGRASENYTDEEAEQFAEVLYTMKPEEVKGWNRSLILRHINLPNQLKDEVIMMIEG